MIIKRIITCVLSVLCMVSCSTMTSEITDSLVALFSAEEKESAIKQGREVLVVKYVCYTESDAHYEVLRLWFCSQPQKSELDSIIFVGKDNQFFRNGYTNNKLQDVLFVDDVPDWEIVLTDNKLNPYLTRKSKPGNTIEGIIKLFESSGYKILERDWVRSFVFSDMAVEKCAKPDGIIIDAYDVLEEKVLDSLQLINNQSIFCCTYVVDTLGQARFSGITKSLIPKEKESQFISYSDSITQRIAFSPAIHRGVYVNSKIGVIYMSHQPGKKIHL